MRQPRRRSSPPPTVDRRVIVEVMRRGDFYVYCENDIRFEHRVLGFSVPEFVRFSADDSSDVGPGAR